MLLDAMHAPILFLFLFLFSTTPRSQAISFPLCQNGGSVWVTERPSITPTAFPNANLWFFCEGQLNILGKSISACVPSNQTNASNGTTTSICTPQVAEAICQLLGYDHAYQQDTKTAPAAPDEPIIALTGDYCLRKNVYSKTLPPNDALASMPGPTCDKIVSITCIRTLNTLAAANALGLDRVQTLAVLLGPTPQVEVTTALYAPPFPEALTSGSAAQLGIDSSSSGGRY